MARFDIPRMVLSVATLVIERGEANQSRLSLPTKLAPGKL